MSGTALKTSGYLAVLVKAPLLGRVKTRLAASTGNRFAQAFALACLADTWANAEQAGATWQPALTVTGGPLPPPWHALKTMAQPEGDLGIRIEAALRAGLAEHPWAMVIGTDSPHISPDTLHAAARHLATPGRAILGPCRDGGFYLLGIHPRPPISWAPCDGSELLSNLPWSQAHTHKRTEARLNEHGFIVEHLDADFDVDTETELGELARLLAKDPTRAPSCAALLRSHGRLPQ